MSRPFLVAVRHAIAAERAVPLMDLLEEVAGTSTDGLDARVLATVTRAKLDARAELEKLHRFVMPPDEEPAGG